jgi:hypothetical protein
MAERSKNTVHASKRAFRAPEVVVGVLLVAGCALGALLWQRSANDTVAVIVANRPIPRGAVISATDLRGAQMGGETGALLPTGIADQIVGRVAAVDIEAAVPLSRSLLAAADPLGVDEALTSLSLSDGELPPDLAVDDPVRIVVTARPDASGLADTSLLEQPATVWSVEPARDGVSTIVTLRGPLSLTTAIVAATSVAVVRIGSATLPVPEGS